MGMFDLTGKTVIVTAGASYLGRAMTEALAEFGANIVITSRDIARAEESARRLADGFGAKTLAVTMDMDEGESVKAMFEKALERFGGLDVLINNSAYSAPGSVTEMSEQTWERGLNGTVNGVFKTTSEALKIMLAQGHGNIINISSMYGVVSPDPSVYSGDIPPNPANYGAGKAAIIQFTKYIACAYGVNNIRANCICPGAFPNPAAYENTDFTSRLAAKTPLKRVGVPDDLKGVTVLLASDASAYITGQNYIVDGGWTAW